MDVAYVLNTGLVSLLTVAIIMHVVGCVDVFLTPVVENVSEIVFNWRRQRKNPFIY
jgi:hypothetical protein